MARPQTPTPPAKTQPKRHPSARRTASRRTKLNPQTIWYVIFLLLWTVVALIASQFIIAYPMAWLLGDAALQPLWTAIYNALVYLLTLVLVILVPPRLYQLYQRRRTAKPTPSSKTTAEQTDTKTSAAPADTAPATNPFTTNRTELGFKHLPTFVDLGLAPIGYIVHLVLATALTSLMSLFTWFNAAETQDTGFSYFITGGDRFVAMIALVFIAPLAEEILMRGWLYGKLRTKLKAPLAILLVSLVFALLHGQWNVGVTVFSLSLVLCTLREITGTIWSGIILHMLSNGIAFYLLYVAV